MGVTDYSIFIHDMILIATERKLKGHTHIEALKDLKF
jgi:hypothetical protein